MAARFLERTLLVVCSVYVFGLAGSALAELPTLLADGVGNIALIVLPVSLAGLHIAAVVFRKAMAGAVEAALLLLMFLTALPDFVPLAVYRMSEGSTVSGGELLREGAMVVMNLLTAAVVLRVSTQARADEQKTLAAGEPTTQLTMLQRARRPQPLSPGADSLRLVFYLVFSFASFLYIVGADRGRSGALLAIVSALGCFGLSCLLRQRSPVDRPGN